MIKKIALFLITLIAIFLLDQYIKSIFIDGFRWDGDYFSLILVYNKGVAFTLLAFLGDSLKYFQGALFLGISLYLIYEKDFFRRFFLPLGILYGAGGSNLYDRFAHEGVVDYVFWHKWFNFAVFNFADVMIDFAIVLILLLMYLEKKTAKAQKR